MKKILIGITLLVIYGCNNFSRSDPQENILATAPNLTSDGQCPKLPPEALEMENITLSSSTITKTLRLTPNQVKVYKFQAQSGKMFNHSYDKDICFWVYDPKGDSVNLDDTVELPMDGSYLVLLSIPKGAATVNLEMSLKNKPASIVDPPTESEKLKKLPIDPPVESRHNITQSKALDIIRGWYSAKGRIFGPPFDRNLLSKYATGKTYYENGQKDGGGSIGWLQRNNCYWTYDFSNIENVSSFNNSGDRPSLRVKVYERLQLHGPSHAGCSKKPNSYRKYVTYWFEKDSGTWKIYNYIVE